MISASLEYVEITGNNKRFKKEFQGSSKDVWNKNRASFCTERTISKVNFAINMGGFRQTSEYRGFSDIMTLFRAIIGRMAIHTVIDLRSWYIFGLGKIVSELEQEAGYEKKIYFYDNGSISLCIGAFRLSENAGGVG